MVQGEGIVRFWESYAGRGVVVQSLRLDGKKFVGMERLVGVKQSLRLDGRKV